MERKDDKSFKRDIIVLISFPILFVSSSVLVNIGKNVPCWVPYVTAVTVCRGNFIASISYFSYIFSVRIHVAYLRNWCRGVKMDLKVMFILKSVCVLAHIDQGRCYLQFGFGIHTIHRRKDWCAS